MILDAWNEYQAKEKLISDTKYDVKLKGMSLQLKRNNGTASDSLELREPLTEMVECDRANLVFWIQNHHQNQG